MFFRVFKREFAVALDSAVPSLADNVSTDDCASDLNTFLSDITAQHTADAPGNRRQGWARDVKARDRDETETIVCSSRDVIETLKFY